MTGGEFDRHCENVETEGYTVLPAALTSEECDAATEELIAPWRRNWSRGPYELCRMVKPEVLERAGAEGRRIFGFDALQPYLEHWQWDRETGEPRPEFREQKRD